MRVHTPVPLTSRPRVSIVIPHYNYGTYLPTSLGSVLSQEGVEVEVIVVDDKSTDGSEAIARSLAASDPRVTLVAHEANMRHVATFNDGLERATGKYVVLLSADDALAPGALARAVAVMEADPAVGLVYGLVEEFFDELPPYHPRGWWWSVWEGEEWIGHTSRRGRNIPTNPEVVMRRSTYEDIGGYDPRLPHSCDMYMWLRAAARGRVGRVNGPVQAYYRIHSRNMHSTQFGGILDDWEAVRHTFDTFFEVDGIALSHPAQLARTARRALAREALIASAGAPDGTDAAHRRQLLRDFARETEPSVVASPVWRWAQAADGGGFLTSELVRRVEAQRWRWRGQRLMRFGT